MGHRRLLDEVCVKVVENAFLTRHEKYNTNSDRKIIRKLFLDAMCSIIQESI